ncbi:MAG: hypothetical protein WBD16_08095 [Pyrinomonadaceae bacterium]
MLLRLQKILVLALFVTTSAVYAQTDAAKPAEVTPTPKPTPATKLDPKNFTADQIAEATIFVYGNGGGRATLGQIRKTTLERGTAVFTNAEGKVERASYQRFVIRGETLAKEKIRLDQEFPGARFSLIFADSKTFGVFNNTFFTPREETVKTFQNQIIRGLEALLRYKENESALALAAKEKHMGVDYHVIDVTDKENRKTRFYISAKSFRVMMITYEDNGVNYKRKFYDYNLAQGTLVPYRTVLWANDRQVEETDVGTITFGQKVDEGLFAAS